MISEILLCSCGVSYVGRPRRRSAVRWTNTLLLYSCTVDSRQRAAAMVRMAQQYFHAAAPRWSGWLPPAGRRGDQHLVSCFILFIAVGVGKVSQQSWTITRVTSDLNSSSTTAVPATIIMSCCRSPRGNPPSRRFVFFLRKNRLHPSTSTSTSGMRCFALSGTLFGGW